LLWLAKEKAIPRNGAPLTPRWERLKAQILDRGVRSRLSPLMRYCSVLGVDPEAVDESVVDGFMAYRALATTRPANQATRRNLAPVGIQNIGGIEGWRSRRWIEPRVKTRRGANLGQLPGWLEAGHRTISEHPHPRSSQPKRTAPATLQGVDTEGAAGRARRGG